MTDGEWDEKIEALSLEPEAIALRQTLDAALEAYWRYFAARGLSPGLRIFVGDSATAVPKNRLN